MLVDVVGDMTVSRCSSLPQAVHCESPSLAL